jgi:catechol 2,3-dioxygenase-like lactoylglutathione lyase family enzyme
MDATSSGLGALTLFVDDLDAVAAFYRDALELDLLFEDDVSAAFDLGGTVLNVLSVSAAPDVVAPATAAPVGAAAQMLLSLWVDDVDAACAELQRHGVVMLNGPVDRAWGKRTAAFTDPAGTVWEIAQDIPAPAADAADYTSATSAPE